MILRKLMDFIRRYEKANVSILSGYDFHYTIEDKIFRGNVVVHSNKIMILNRNTHIKFFHFDYNYHV